MYCGTYRIAPKRTINRDVRNARSKSLVSRVTVRVGTCSKLCGLRVYHRFGYFAIDPATIFQRLFFFSHTRMNFSEKLELGLS